MDESSMVTAARLSRSNSFAASTMRSTWIAWMLRAGHSPKLAHDTRSLLSCWTLHKLLGLYFHRGCHRAAPRPPSNWTSLVAFLTTTDLTAGQWLIYAAVGTANLWSGRTLENHAAGTHPATGYLFRKPGKCNVAVTFDRQQPLDRNVL